MPYAQSHHKNHSSHCLTQSSEPTPFLLLNLMTNRVVRYPQDHPAYLKEDAGWEDYDLRLQLLLPAEF
jgi:hypothetical protein